MQVDQSLNLLDSLNTALRCDAIQFLLQTLKCKYPEACDQVVRNLFSHIAAANDSGGGDGGGGGAQQQEIARTKQLQLLLTAKKEKREPGTGGEAEIKRENDEDEAGSTDLNQNFEKILCKEEFLCLEEEEEDFLDDADTQNSSSLQFNAGNNVDALALGPGDPLDLIHSGSSLLVKRKYAATFEDEDQDQLAEDTNSNSNSSDGKLVKRKRTNNMHLTVTSVRRKEARSRLGEGYIFHEDSQYTMRYHHSTGEFSERAFKAQFRALLRMALSQHHKPFLRQFYENFVVNGRLLGTTPSARVLKELREQRLEEWRRHRERRQLISMTKQSEQQVEEIQPEEQREEIQQQQQLEEIQQQQHQQQLEEIQRHHQLPAISFGDSELESETESQLSSAAQEIMKFEEFIDEGVGAGRLIDGLEMELETDDMLAGAGSVLDSVNSVSGHSSNSSSSGSGSAGNGNGISISSGVVLENNSHHL